MSTVECVTLEGHNKIVQQDRLILYPAAYAIVMRNGKILLLKMRHTGKYHLPGGGINVGERIEAALKRELREETGIEIGTTRFAHFEEFFFYYDPSGKAYHGLFFFYICRAKTFGLLRDDKVDDESAERPRWVDIRGLQAKDFQSHGQTILRLCRDTSR
jgi:nucleoside triphosphatase